MNATNDNDTNLPAEAYDEIEYDQRRGDISRKLAVHAMYLLQRFDEVVQLIRADDLEAMPTQDLLLSIANTKDQATKRLFHHVDPKHMKVYVRQRLTAFEVTTDE